jgi:hypothetical protein
MSGNLSDLVATIERSTIPSWLRKGVKDCKKPLLEGKRITIFGPNSEVVTIHVQCEPPKRKEER